ncbi:hypothetical protein H4218_005078 [Coemansia sp. IMI 209128]|nr:hypothetical protein H4218_005078 [Coemansia sp. IMI 209128]
MGEPAVLIKDVWSTAGNSSASDTRESSALNILHAEFDRSSEFSDSFARFVSTGPVYIKQGDALVEDTTTTAFVGLPSVSQARQHRRTMTKLEGSLISEADDESKVVIAIADAMAALHAVHVKCKILHGNISDRAILLQKTADGIKGVLADFDYVSIDGDSVVETPELKSFQSIHSLRNPGAARTFLDDAESLLYLVCWLGTFGINHEQRAQHVAGPGLLILHWSKGAAAKIAAHKRLHMANTDTFGEAILSGMRNVNGPLYRLALSIYRALFARPGCVGTIPVSNLRFGNAGVPNAVRVLDTESNPLVLRNRFVNDIKGNLLEILDRYRKTALAALHTDRAP